MCAVSGDIVTPIFEISDGGFCLRCVLPNRALQLIQLQRTVLLLWVQFWSRLRNTNQEQSGRVLLSSRCTEKLYCGIPLQTIRKPGTPLINHSQCKPTISSTPNIEMQVNIFDDANPICALSHGESSTMGAGIAARQTNQIETINDWPVTRHAPPSTIVGCVLRQNGGPTRKTRAGQHGY